MVQGYYTMDEAARILGVHVDELKQMAKRGELRGFQDRGTLRFRTQDVEELARRRGAGSDPALPLGEAPAPQPADSPAPRSGSKAADVFNFALDSDDDQVQIGQEILGGTSPSGKKVDSKRGGPSTPKPGSDSDVRLVADGSDLDFHIASDSDVKLEDAGPKSGGSKSGGPKSGPKSGGPKSGPKSGAGAPPGTPPRRTGAHLDSGVRLVDMDSDSDVKIVGADNADSDVPLGRQPPKGASDSDIRLEFDAGPAQAGGGSDDSLLTEEIDLDAEIRKAEEAAAKAKSDPQVPSLGKSKPPEFPTTSPFELSEDDLRLELPADEQPLPQAKAKSDSSDMLLTPQAGPDSSDFDLNPSSISEPSPLDSSSDFDLSPDVEAASPLESSSDFDLTPAGDSSAPLEPASDEFQLEVNDEVGLGDMPPAKAASSGINLKEPADSGISLEQGGEGSDEIEFELSLDEGSTPKPAPAAADSDSEFELTIDETGGLAPLEEEAPAAAQDEKDIFETDFDVPALEDESGSQAVALDSADTDLESSDFDIALDEGDMAAEDESGSEVIALDEEGGADVAARTPPPKKKKKGATVVLSEDEEGGFEGLMEGGELEEEAEAEVEEEEEAVPAGAALAAPAPEWGIWGILLLPGVAVLLLVALMGFEMMQGAMGYSKPGMLTKQFAKLIGAPLKD